MKKITELPRSGEDLTEPTKSRLLTVNFSGLFLSIFTSVLCFAFFFLAQNYQQAYQIDKALIDNSKLVAVKQTQLYYLNNSAMSIDEMLIANTATHFIEQQHHLIRLNELLIGLQSSHQSSYILWQQDQKSTQVVASRLQNNAARNANLKQQALTLLENLEETAEKVFNNEPTNLTLHHSNNKISKLSYLIKAFSQLSIQTSYQSFELLRVNFAELLLILKDTYGNELEDDNAIKLIEQVDALERLMFVDQMLMSKWQGQLRLAEEYRRSLRVYQKQLKATIAELTQNVANKRNLAAEVWAFEGYISQLNTLFIFQKPIIVGLVLLVITLLLLLGIAHRVRCMNQSIQQHVISQASSNYHSEAQRHDNAPVTVEEIEKTTEQVALNLPQYKKFTEELSSAKLTIAQLTDENTSLKDELEQQLTQHREQLNTAKLSINSQCFQIRKSLALTMVNNTTCTRVTRKAAQQGDEQRLEQHAIVKQLDNQLEQWQSFTHLQSGNTTLTLSDVDMESELHAVLLNRLGMHDKRVRLVIADQIRTHVKLDRAIFNQLIEVFLFILLSDKSEEKSSSNAEIVVEVKLKDINSGQQHVLFSASSRCFNKTTKLPRLLAKIQSEERLHSGEWQLNYFHQLLHVLHGNHLSAILVDGGYQLSFILPLAMTSDKSIKAIREAEDENQQHNAKMLERLLGGNCDFADVLTAQQINQGRPPLMPLNALVAVQHPKKHQVLLRLLSWCGLNIKVVTSEKIQNIAWGTGQFSLLFSQFKASPFIEFGTASLNAKSICRGVFGLAGQYSEEAEKDFSHWQVSNIDEPTDLATLATLLSPWLFVSLPKQVDHVAVSSDKPLEKMPVLTADPSKNNEEIFIAFDFQQYIKHQGSVDLAIYMLDEYVQSCVEQCHLLANAMASAQDNQASEAVKMLQKNAKILAADQLLALCKHWETLLASDQSATPQGFVDKLLHKTHHAVSQIVDYTKQL